ncbi:MAG: transcription elongation factor Spt5 [Amphiamblys sp. WSBS2006]|nr:MAG: transcription elongation factor Spt5 [Amphiamblys sp. WSBS2006]
MPKRQRRSVGQFFETAAGTSSSDEDVWEGGSVEAEESEEMRVAREMAQRRLAERKTKERTVAEMLEKKYGEEEAGGESEESGEEVAVQQLFSAPRKTDPHVWAVGCPAGHEQETVWRLGKTLSPSGGIVSIFWIEKYRGTVYVESFREDRVLSFVRREDSLFGSKVALVDPDEVGRLLEEKDECLFEPGQWARVKGGKYAGDLALVVETLPGPPRKVVVLVVPRYSTGESSGKRPERKFFDRDGVSLAGESSRLSYNRERGLWQYKKESYTADGYCERTLSARGLAVEDPPGPSKEEIRFFRKEAEKSEDEKAKKRFLEGDRVVIKEGEFVGMTGRLVEAGKSEVTVQPDGEDVFGRVTVRQEAVEKWFSVGASVRVEGGKALGRTGTVVAWDGECYEVLVGGTREGVSVEPAHLSASGEAREQKEERFVRRMPRTERAREAVEGRSVRILGGPYKGYVGVVRGLSADMATVELHTSSKCVQVRKESILVGEEKAGDREGKTPALGGVPSKTPMWSGMEGRTPMWGGMERRRDGE